jgi:hypothetical protein
MKKETIKYFLAILAIPLFIYFMQSEVNPGMAFLLGIAYRNIAD